MGPPKIPQADWSKYKAYLHDLYIAQDRTLSQVIQQAENELGFRSRCVKCRDVHDPDHSDCDASQVQYIRQFKKWKFEKNLRGDQWKRIAKIVRNRKSFGKDGEILIKNGRVTDRRLRKEMSRYRPQEHDDFSSEQVRLRRCTKPLIWLADLTYEDMDGIIIGTPQGEALQPIHHLQLPWFRFQTLIEPYCKLRAFRAWHSLALIFPSRQNASRRL